MLCARTSIKGMKNRVAERLENAVRTQSEKSRLLPICSFSVHFRPGDGATGIERWLRATSTKPQNARGGAAMSLIGATRDYVNKILTEVSGMKALLMDDETVRPFVCQSQTESGF